jgi:hypothetical protein
MDEFMIFRLGYLEYTSRSASFDSPETSKERVQEWFSTSEELVDHWQLQDTARDGWHMMPLR